MSHRWAAKNIQKRQFHLRFAVQDFVSDTETPFPTTMAPGQVKLVLQEKEKQEKKETKPAKK